VCGSHFHEQRTTRGHNLVLLSPASWSIATLRTVWDSVPQLRSLRPSQCLVLPVIHK
jgi:hypothetical protein